MKWPEDFDSFTPSPNAIRTTPAYDASLDAFGRQRVSTPYTVFDCKQLHDKQPLLFDEMTSGGSETSTHSTGSASVLMTVSASNEYVIRQTFQRFNYQPGKSQLVLMTFVAPHDSGTIKRIGVINSGNGAPYTPFNGMYLEVNQSSASFVIMKEGVANIVHQQDWNDPMDGTGRSCINLNFANSQILMIDYEWLGVGRVRFGFNVDGITYVAHAFNNANNIKGVYTSTPNLPMRYEIRSQGGSGTLEHICTSIQSEGGLTPAALTYNLSTQSEDVDAQGVTTGNDNNTYAIIGMRLQADKCDVECVPESISMLCASNSSFRWTLIHNPSIAGTFEYRDIPYSPLQIATGSTPNIVTGGIIIDGGYVYGGNTAGNQIDVEILNTLRIGASISGTLDHIVLCANRISAQAETFRGSITTRVLS